MNKIEKQKGQLIGMSIAIMVVSAIIMILGVIMVVSGALKSDGGLGMKIALIIFGVLFALIGIAGVAFGLVFIITGKSLSATRGSVAESNLGKGTVNMTKCANCGQEIRPGDKFCGKCGHSLEETKVCSDCGAVNTFDAKVCTNCGKEL